MFQRFFKVCFHHSEIPFLPFFATDHDMVRSCYTILREQFGQQGAKSALHSVAGYGITNFFGYGDAIANGIGGNGMVVAAFMGEQDEAWRHESLAAIRSQKIRPFPNHFDIASSVLIVDKLRLRIGHRITLYSAGADALGRELLAAT